MDGRVAGWTCCIIVVVGAETVTDCLPYSVDNEPFGQINITAASQKIPYHFVQPEGSSPCPQQPDICPYARSLYSITLLSYPAFLLFSSC